jgi:hypothetical protein
MSKNLNRRYASLPEKALQREKLRMTEAGKDDSLGFS